MSRQTTLQTPRMDSMTPSDSSTTSPGAPSRPQPSRPPQPAQPPPLQTVTRRAERDWALRPLAPPGSRTARLWRWIGAAGGCLLGAVLLVAVWGKALDPHAFAELLQSEGLLSWALPAPAAGAAGGTAAAGRVPVLPETFEIFALAALAVEAALGMALLLGLRRLWVMVPVTLLVALFVALNGRTWWLSAHGQAAGSASCGCFGNLVQRTPAEAFWQDLLLLVPALLLAWRGRRQPPTAPPRTGVGVRPVVVALFTLAVVVFAWRAPALPLDDLATRLKPGAAVDQLCAGDPRGGGACLNTVVPDLDHGNHLVVLGDVGDPALARAVPALNAYAGSPNAAAVWLLTAADEASQRKFFWKWGPTFRIVEAPAELLRPLYRRLPRSFAVQDGRVTATFSGLPPLPTAGAAADHHSS